MTPEEIKMFTPIGKALIDVGGFLNTLKSRIPLAKPELADAIKGRKVQAQGPGANEPVAPGRPTPVQILAIFADAQAELKMLDPLVLKAQRAAKEMAMCLNQEKMKKETVSKIKFKLLQENATVQPASKATLDQAVKATTQRGEQLTHTIAVCARFEEFVEAAPKLTMLLRAIK